MTLDCPFCGVSKARVVSFNEVAIALHDSFPVSQGHTLIVPREHVASIFELSSPEQAGLWQLVADVRCDLSKQFSPDGFNIGINDGKAAGQTILHTHIHVIPRYKGDVRDPRGGVRWIIPERAAYWENLS